MPLPWICLLAVLVSITTSCTAQTIVQPDAAPTAESQPQPIVKISEYGGEYFPAGSPSELIVHSNTIIVLNSWSRGDSVLIFQPNGAGHNFTAGVPVMGYMFQSTVQNNFLYIANWFSMVVVDVHQSCFGHPDVAYQMLFHFPSGSLNTIASSPDRLYLGDRKDGLRVLDITTPGSPILIAYLPELGGIQAIAASPSRVVVKTTKGQALIAIPSQNQNDGIDIQATLPLKGSLTLIDQILYESTGKDINIYDLKDAKAPVLVQTLDGLRVLTEPFNHQMLVAKDKSTLILMDVTSPAHPKVVREIPLRDPLPAGRYVFQNDHLFVLDKTHSLVQDFKIPPKAVHGITPQEQIVLMRNAGTLEVVEQRSENPDDVLPSNYLKAYCQGDQITLISTGAHKKTGGWTGEIIQQTMAKKSGFRHYSQQWAAAMVRLGPYVLLGNGVVDISNIEKPKVIVPTTRPAANIFMDHQFAFLAQGDRMTILDMTAMPKPVTLGQYMSPSKKQTIVDVTAQGHIAHALSTAKDHSILETLDVTDAANPKLIAQLQLPFSIAMTRHGHYLYIPSVNQPGQNDGGPVLNIVDISKPDQPKIVATIKDLLRGDCYRLKVDQNILYIADDAAGILALDLANPIKPVLTTIYRGSDDRLQVYTDLIIDNHTLYALRYAQIDAWDLPGHQEK